MLTKLTGRQELTFSVVSAPLQALILKKKKKKVQSEGRAFVAAVLGSRPFTHPPVLGWTAAAAP